MNEKIKSLLTEPKTYKEIRSLLPPQAHKNYNLAIKLARMAWQGEIYYKEHPKYAMYAPVYSLNPIPKGFEFPKREGQA